jgi:hypothetical protein
MVRVLSGKGVVLGILAAATGVVAVLAACSSSSSPTTGGLGGDGGGGTGTQACTNNSALQIVFSPMYSAYEPSHKYQIPAVVNGIDPSVVSWSASDTSVVDLAPDMDTGGTMITVKGAGMVTITANANGLCGSSVLNITSAQSSDWDMGNARYNNGVPLDFRCIMGSPTTRDGGPCPDAGPACTNCHGPTANAGFGFNDISHTPEQTGGFSDQDLIDIIANGVVPDGGYFDPSIVQYPLWQQFHQWKDIQGPAAQGMVVYLRSLTPESQNGSANFGGHYDGGGGHHDGGFHGEGGGPPPGQDSGGGGGGGDAGTGTD